MAGTADALRLIDVAVPVPTIDGALTYAVPDKWRGQVQVGQRVKVRVGRRGLVGLVVGPGDERVARPRLIDGIIDAEPAVTEAQLALCRFVSEYYFSPLGECTRLILPPDTAREMTLRYKRTERGATAQVFGAAMNLSAKDQDVLTKLDEATARSARALGTTRERLEKLVGLGLVEVVEQKAAGSARVDEQVVVLEGGEEVPSRAYALAALDAWLRTIEVAPRVSEVAMSFPGARGKLKRLADLGRVRLDDAVRVASKGAGLSPRAPARDLTDAQRAAIDALCDALDKTSEAPDAANAAGAFLLEGVTGSGKTEVYLEALRHALDSNRGALLVVPEIALTPQLLARVEGALPSGDEVVVLHSGLGKADRRDAWMRLLRGEARVAVGARSALFAPVQQLGLIVVDEEHEPSLKQDETPRYHGRDVALLRARAEGAVCVLGSATPSLESRHNADIGKLRRLSLPERVGGAGTLPTVEIVDLKARHGTSQMRKADRPALDGAGVVLSAPLRAAMQQTLDDGEQVLLFLNRRGWSSVMLCDACGDAVECKQCSVSMTWHKGRGCLVCHQCDTSCAAPEQCPTCGTPAMIAVGLGTERVEGEVEAAFPEATIARLDRDTVRTKGGMVETLTAIARREVDIVIGTQMVAKGHDFPHIALVGVVLADVALGMPDFRASERAFALLTQVAGRAGRGERPGRVLVQTYQPDHPAVRFAQTHDVVGFSEQEMRFREEAKYPPFWRVALCRIDGEDATAVDARARDVAAALRQVAPTVAERGQWDVLGPAPAPIERIRGRTRYQVFLRCLSARDRARIVGAVRRDERLTRALAQSRCRLILDVDPMGVL
jgi:primosomal protein N' (replication factor Y)